MAPQARVTSVERVRDIEGVLEDGSHDRGKKGPAGQPDRGKKT